MATRPGFHSATNFNNYPSEFSLAIRSIGKSFYITRSFESVEIGNSVYWGLLARPAEDFSIHLNADREILFVFSKYKDFEIRTLESYDEFYSQLEHKRIDKSIRFLISGDPRVEAKVQHYLHQNPEYPIIVPSYLPRIGGGGDELLGAVRKNYLLRDLFGYQNPLREETFFFGRQEEVNSILDLAKSGQSSSVFGLRKSGKTSAIYAIMRKAKSFDFIPVLIDCQSPFVHAQEYKGLLSHILDEIRKSLGQKRRTSVAGESDAEVAEKFKDLLKSSLGQAKARVLVIFDEIENITPGSAASPHWNDGRDSLLFWQNIRSFIQREASGKLALCLVGTSPSLLEMPKLSGVANPMYLFTQKKFIPSFSFSETKEMVNRLSFFMGLEFSDTQIASLHKDYGGHPFFIRQVCSNVHRLVDGNRPKKISDRNLQEAIESFGGELDRYLSEILSGIKENYYDEFELLKSITLGDTAEVSEYGREAPELIDHLVGYGLVERRGDDIDIRFDAVRHALRNLFSVRGADSFWVECMERRNSLEVDIRRELFIEARRMEHSEWDCLLKESLTSRRYDQLDTIEPRKLFSKSNCPLYWTDLIAIIKSEVVFSHLGDRRTDVMSAMNTINFKGRKDSHANEISETDFELVRAAFEVLEDEFGLPT